MCPKSRGRKGVGWQSGSETDDDYEDDDDGDDGSEADLASGSGSSDDSEESEPVYYNNRVNKSGIDLFLCDVVPLERQRETLRESRSRNREAVAASRHF